MKRLLEKYLKIYVHESQSFLWISAIFFVIFFVTAIFRTYVDAAFIKRYGPQYIPYMLVINALLTFVVMGVIDRLSRRFMDYHLLAGFLASYAGSVTVLFIMVRADISVAYPILYQLLYLLDSVLLVFLWNMAGDLFNARQGKRIFPLVTASQVLGTTIGSFVTGPANAGRGARPDSPHLRRGVPGDCNISGPYGLQPSRGCQPDEELVPKATLGLCLSPRCRA